VFEGEQIETAKKVFEEKLSVRQTEKLSTGPTKKRKKLQIKDPNTLRLEREVSDALGAQVQILQNRKRGGKLTINFANPEDLQRILERIKG
jgi:ParB family chromosome partitioning protein